MNVSARVTSDRFASAAGCWTMKTATPMSPHYNIIIQLRLSISVFRLRNPEWPKLHTVCWMYKWLFTVLNETFKMDFTDEEEDFCCGISWYMKYQSNWRLQAGCLTVVQYHQCHSHCPCRYITVLTCKWKEKDIYG